jgi:hypothetical protein
MAEPRRQLPNQLPESNGESLLKYFRNDAAPWRLAALLIVQSQHIVAAIKEFFRHSIIMYAIAVFAQPLSGDSVRAIPQPEASAPRATTATPPAVPPKAQRETPPGALR